MERVPFLLGEVVEADVGASFLPGENEIETLEQAAIQERDGLGEGEEFLRIAEERGVPQEVGRAAVGIAAARAGGFVPEGTGGHLLIQRSEEEILEDGAVVVAIARSKIAEQLAQDAGAKKRAGEEPLFQKEPAEDKTCEKTG